MLLLKTTVISRFWLGLFFICLGACAQAQSQAQATLPPHINALLARAKIPADAISVMVVDVEGKKPSRLSYRSQQQVNPASVMKLVTSYAALDILGPAYTWNTPVFWDGEINQGALKGNLYIQGQGDPKLVLERVWLMLHRLKSMGVQVIVGDIVLDNSAFQIAPEDPADFDGEPYRPYNVAADALLLNFKALTLTFSPNLQNGTAQISHDMPLAGVQIPSSIALAPASVACADFRGALKPVFEDSAKITLNGHYPAACGERSWSLAYADPTRYAARALEGLWRQVGGKLTGQVRTGSVPAHLQPRFYATSAPLAEIIRDVNKYSNNVMAKQLFLTLSLKNKGLGTLQDSNQIFTDWWRTRIDASNPKDIPAPENGAGLSRNGYVTANGLTRMLQKAWSSEHMPDFISSLPINGVDGTLRNVKQRKTVGAAHLKTGSLRDVNAMAGYIHASSGQRYTFVAIINHANAAQGSDALQALVKWAADDL